MFTSAWLQFPVRRGALVVGIAALLGTGAVVALVPMLPAGPDIYAHLIWAYGAMRCIAQGAPPVWLADLNAGFGSAGIRLYSPLPATFSGLLGLAFGSAGSGVRLTLLLSLAALLGLLWRHRGRSGASEWLLLVISPVAAYSLFGRGAVAEFCAIPLVWWLLERALGGKTTSVRDGALLGACWLVHVPTTVMVAVLVAVTRGVQGGLRELRKVGGAGLVAAGLTAWHWLPMLAEASMVGSGAALTGTIYAAAHNFLGSPRAHALADNIWLGWCAIGVLAATLVGRWWRDEPLRFALVLGCVALASPLSVWLYRAPWPLRILQFPWRWLLPAAVLAAAPLRASLARGRGKLAASFAFAPLLLVHFPLLVRDPGLGPSMAWREAGGRVYAALGGSPFLVDVIEHRPPWWAYLPANLVLFRDDPVVLEPAVGTWQVERWRPLCRQVTVNLRAPANVSLRMLTYPYWRLAIDGVATRGGWRSGVIGTTVAAGSHVVDVSWSGSPLAPLGQAVTAATLLLLVVRTRRGRDP